MANKVRKASDFGTYESLAQAVLDGEYVECEVDEVEQITSYLSDMHHNGVVITGNNPWLISVMPKE